jgi:pescadillo protein
LSIKGIYYSAEIQGQDILWLVPYKFAQNVPVDVDFRIMHTFVEFYTTLLGFVMFKLYTNEGLVYPPKFDQEADAKGAGLRAFKLENKGIGMIAEAAEAAPVSKNKKEVQEAAKQTRLLQDKIAAITEGEDEEIVDAAVEKKDDTADGFDTFKPIKSDSAVDVLPQPQIANNTTGDVDPSNLFAPYTFYLSRETPREPLEFLLRSFGCKRIGWDAVLGDGAFTDNELDPSITHQIVDRPPVVGLPPAAEADDAAPRAGGRVAGRIYIQPQYVWDCINAGRLLAAADYAPGALLPPHLSPWVKVSSGEYDPTAPVAAGEEEEVSEDEDDHGMTEDLEEADEDETMEVDVQVDEEEADESEDEEEAARRQHQKELEAEAAGVKLAAEEKKKQKKKSKAEREAEEQKEMQKIMMTKKKRKLYEKMIYSNNKKEAEAETLRQKRRKLEKSKKKTAAA